METVTVAIPTFNEEHNISGCLNSLSFQTYKDIEVIVIDDGSEDDTIRIVKKYHPNIRLLQQKHSGPGAAWNLAASLCNGSVFLIVGADTFMDKNYVMELVTPILNGETKLTKYTTEITKNKWAAWARCFSMTDKEMKEACKMANENPGAFSAILTKEYLDMGGLDPGKGYADDSTFFERGLIPKPIPKAIVYHNRPDTLGKIFRHYSWIGKSFAMNKITHGQWFKRFGIILSLFVIVGLIGVTLRFYPLLLLSLPIFFLFTLAHKTTKRMKNDFWLPYIYRYPIFYTTKLFGYGWGVIDHALNGDNLK